MIPAVFQFFRLLTIISLDGQPLLHLTQRGRNRQVLLPVSDIVRQLRLHNHGVRTLCLGGLGLPHRRRCRGMRPDVLQFFKLLDVRQLRLHNHGVRTLCLGGLGLPHRRRCSGMRPAALQFFKLLDVRQLRLRNHGVRTLCLGGLGLPHRRRCSGMRPAALQFFKLLDDRLQFRSQAHAIIPFDRFDLGHCWCRSRPDLPFFLGVLLPRNH
mmetsp:Transcript_50034/g.113516  ORF Transcript_50034/g.113516 Transcript_50034/m.113516 type:complete len:211 (+) Transcript_50034:123-755(+)